MDPRPLAPPPPPGEGAPVPLPSSWVSQKARRGGESEGEGEKQDNTVYHDVCACVLIHELRRVQQGCGSSSPSLILAQRFHPMCPPNEQARQQFFGAPVRGFNGVGLRRGGSFTTCAACAGEHDTCHPTSTVERPSPGNKSSRVQKKVHPDRRSGTKQQQSTIYNRQERPPMAIVQ